MTRWVEKFHLSLFWSEVLLKSYICPWPWWPSLGSWVRPWRPILPGLLSCRRRPGLLSCRHYPGPLNCRHRPGPLNQCYPGGFPSCLTFFKPASRAYTLPPHLTPLSFWEGGVMSQFRVAFCLCLLFLCFFVQFPATLVSTVTVMICFSCVSLFISFLFPI